jgi:hypothetical protein
MNNQMLMTITIMVKHNRKIGEAKIKVLLKNSYREEHVDIVKAYGENTCFNF